MIDVNYGNKMIETAAIPSLNQRKWRWGSSEITRARDVAMITGIICVLMLLSEFTVTKEEEEWEDGDDDEHEETKHKRTQSKLSYRFEPTYLDAYALFIDPFL